MNTIIAIAALAVLVLVVEIVNLRKLIVPMTVIGLLAILGITLNNLNVTESFYNNMIVVDSFSVAFSSLFIVLTTFLVALSTDFYENEDALKISDYVSLKLFLLLGAVSMVSFGNMAMFFLGLEILSITLYILAGSNRTHIKSNEAGMKYFLLGSFASGVILFGIALIYGATGSFDLHEIFRIIATGAIPAWYKIGVLMMIIGMLFKIAAVPFHFWAPDVYQGAPSLTTAMMSTLAKVVAVATLYKLSVSLTVTMPSNYMTAIVVIAILTMTVGNIMALRQDNIKRLLAYSGISHAGFMMMALVNLGNSAPSLFYYAVAYAIAGIAAFSVVILVTKNKDEELLSLFKGLGKTNPLLAGILTASLLSMGGIPIFAGFFGKFFLFSQALENNQLTLVIFGAINSFISIYYYFKVIAVLYSKNEETEQTEPIKVPMAYYAVGIISITINIVIGIYPSIILDMIK
ncbi:NADH-quinone oxidoreductase subunit N [Flavobacterium sp. HSC-61S13]|uniref:NADH-quinone oxidoreductase subunit N n=1 Tax=Flavobacterium sp. HSC-61S13 TaxID=2910963 RepID=UPI00209E2F10|nr:NADH-quinone oxidoreductase subunit N [Flavobacterium sp. HSC-61S13]MCP1996718.1 NADH-quinone oxidoreductase subunit N [Flavobacterium sp. HSC-61S13]